MTKLKSNQRKAMFARLNSKRLIVFLPKLKNMTYLQLKRTGIILKPNTDIDKDKVKNKKDCRPLDPKKQGFAHTLRKQRMNEMATPIKKKGNG